MSDYIIIRVKRPEDYEGVTPDLVAEDFIATAQYGQWEWEARDEDVSLAQDAARWRLCWDMQYDLGSCDLQRIDDYVAKDAASEASKED